MKPFTVLTSCLIPLANNDVDTDQIIPARYLKVTDKAGLAEGLFAGWRYLPDGQPKPEFPLNQEKYQGCQVLLAGDNFGCGSSREHAPWALVGWGIRAVISTSFADIFQNNALKNGLLPVRVETATHRQLIELADGPTPVEVTIDLANKTLHLPGGVTASFPIDPFNQLCLLQGVDSLGYLLNQEARIAEFERRMSLANRQI
jgi:3-isopropylmalate/(R)-2-methylmalate dehydratase small subunit